MPTCYFFPTNQTSSCWHATLASCALGLSAAHAQTPAPPPQAADLCQSFQRNEAGQWCPTQRVTITNQHGGQISLSPGACFKAGVQFNGIDIGRELEPALPLAEILEGRFCAQSHRHPADCRTCGFSR